MISIIFLGVLGLLFVLLVILTIVLIFTKKKDDDDDDELGYDEDTYADYGEESYEEPYEEPYDTQSDYEESGDVEETYDGVAEDEEAYEDASSDEQSDDDLDVEELLEDMDETEDEVGSEDGVDEAYAEPAAATMTEDETVSDAKSDDVKTDDVKSDDVKSDDTELDDIAAAGEIGQEAEPLDDAFEKASDEGTKEAIPVLEDEMGDYSDSAFAPANNVDDKLSDEALIASYKEAQEMSENVMNGTYDSEFMFGVGDELDKYKKKTRSKSTVSSDEDFYWYNKMDVNERPSYKTPEMYYHYFNLPKDCIDDLLTEMYDCAVVRTEEIRYIAYGIKPKAVSLKDIMREGNYYYTDQPKQKEPLPQDLIRIYEKWCGYVDKLFDKIEIHADEMTIQKIKKLLCEYGRSDVDVLLEGR